MSTVAIVVVVVGACIGVVTSVLTRSVEPATDRAPDQRARRADAPVPDSAAGAAVAFAPRRPAVSEPALEAELEAELEPLVGEPVDRIRWWQRLRSAIVLGVLSVALGVAAAAAVGLVAIVLFGLLRGAVG